jgi:drug/metabolite transporter (DMT)-like permease
MPIAAIFLLLLSACMHAVWNLLLKRSEEKMPAMGWIVILGGVFSFFILLVVGSVPLAMWKFIIVSVLLEVIYFILLSSAYSDHDFSLVYPIARGAAPAFLMLWSVLFAEERLTDGGMLGVGLIVSGMMIIGAAGLIQSREGGVRIKGILLALCVALLISLYTLVDGTAVKQTPPLSYALMIFMLIPIPTTIYNIRRYGWTRFASVWNGSRVTLICAAILGVASYLTALYAFTFAPLGYSGAIREVSVVIGAFLGWQFLNEEVGGTRVIGSLVIFVGILVIALYG